MGCSISDARMIIGLMISIVKCKIVIDGLCNRGKLDKAIDIVNGM
jgi:pentatricopeptide repeat protein